MSRFVINSGLNPVNDESDTHMAEEKAKLQLNIFNGARQPVNSVVS
jgi:hypothetical protein